MHLVPSLRISLHGVLLSRRGQRRDRLRGTFFPALAAPRVRAAFRAALLAMPVRTRVAAPRCAAAFGERLVPWRWRAERLACRESAAFDAAPLPSRFNAFEMARARLRDGARGSRSPWPIS